MCFYYYHFLGEIKKSRIRGTWYAAAPIGVEGGDVHDFSLVTLTYLLIKFAAPS